MNSGILTEVAAVCKMIGKNESTPHTLHYSTNHKDGDYMED
jgi:hypothetical protein